jgi:hypothetical protein
MAKKLHLTLACGDYEIVRPLIEGIVQPDGIELTVLTDMTSDIRHWRMIRNREFDVCELWIRGILEQEFGVDHKKLRWYTQDEEEVPFAPPKDLFLERVTAGKEVETMLVEG